MQPKDRKRFQAALLKTKVSLPGPNLTTEELALRDQVFWEELNHYSIEDVESAFEQARSTLKFFPAPSEIIDYCYHEAQLRYLQSKPLEQRALPQWAEPTEEGRVLAKQMIDDLYSKWDADEKAEEKAKIEKREKRKKQLREQAEMLGVKL